MQPLSPSPNPSPSLDPNPKQGVNKDALKTSEVVGRDSVDVRCRAGLYCLVRVRVRVKVTSYNPNDG